MELPAAYAEAEAFVRGDRGASLKSVKLAGATTLEAHDRLLRAGFRVYRTAIPGARTFDGAPQWLAARGLTGELAKARSEHIYVHDDGGLVRLYLEGGPTLGFDELAPDGGPFVRRSLLGEGRVELGWDDEVAVITEEGTPLPKALRSEDGFPSLHGDPLKSYRLALAFFAEHRIALRPVGWSFPKIAPSEIRGLGAGLTIVPHEDFWAAARILEESARDVGGIEIRERDADLQLLCAGSEEVREALEGSGAALASITLHRGTHVIGIDPIGYEDSMRAMVELVATVLPLLGRVGAYENASGMDVSELLARRPRAVLASLNASVMTYSAKTVTRR